jgi:hypothetical protein
MFSLPTLRTNYLVLLIILACIALIIAGRMLQIPLLHSLTIGLWDWVIILSACGLLLGALNVLWVHLRRILAGGREWTNSLVLVVTALAVFLTGTLSQAGTQSFVTEWVFDSILVPGQATLFALLAFFMAAAAYRYLRIGGAQGGGWMLAGAALFLLVQTPMLNALLSPAAAGFAGWILDVPAMATLRGALLGSSIALIVLGARLALSGK